MEFLDPKKQKAYLIRLVIGYILVGIALILTTTILLYYAYGFGINKNGQVIQNGLIFISSSPNPADIYINGQKRSETTNTRLLLPGGQYVLTLQRQGYQTWKRAIAIEGGVIVHVDYPVLFPTKLTTTTVRQYAARPSLLTESPDLRWLLVQDGAFQTPIDLYDLSNPTKLPTTITIPPTILGFNTGTQSWQAVDWANDSRHLLLKHVAIDNGIQKSEYILVDRATPESSQNLSTLFASTPTSLEFRNGKFDNYFLFDAKAQTIATAALDSPSPTIYLDHVIGYKDFGSDNVVYATATDSTTGKMSIKLYQNGKTYPIRQVSISDHYVLDIAQYGGDWYVVAGSPADGRTYVYKNPASDLDSNPKGPLVPVYVLKGVSPDYVDFSNNDRFVAVEQGQQVAVYDAETDKGYTYTLADPLDAPQPHVRWMDGHRLTYVSRGKATVLDFDDTNVHALNTADPELGSFFDSNYKYLFSFSNAAPPSQLSLDKTALRIPSDL